MEHAAILALRKEDSAGFERNVAQLQAFYGASSDAADAASATKYELLGVNLLRLLALDRIAEFHTELELIPLARRTSERAIQYPVAMEQYMMEGAYYRAVQGCRQTPSPLFDVYARMLAQTVRTQIAECISRAYATLSLKETSDLLMLTDVGELKQFEAQFDWKRSAANANAYDFARSRPSEQLHVPKPHILAKTLSYASELERIV